MFGIQSILLGDADLVVAGGMESMSNTPFYMDKARFGYKLGHGSIIDGILKDGLWDVYNDFHMGNAAELCAEECSISREEQDEYAVNSYKRAAEATANGYFSDEITPVEVAGRKESTTVSEDEEYQNIKYEKVPKLKPVFQKGGTVTAANSSTINDGAAALILASEEKVNELGLQPVAKVVSYADAAKEPERFTTAPAEALRKAASKADKALSDIDYFEINEAFSVVPMANNQLLNLDPEKVNVFGGAVSMGHPIGCSGARILVTLTSVLRHKGGQTGAIGICNGGVA
jgi:acetyl-CoA C-acetyltransferase